MFAQWMNTDPMETDLGPLIQGREVVVTAMDERGITVIPCEPSQAATFPWGEMEAPTIHTEDGTVICLLPR